MERRRAEAAKAAENARKPRGYGVVCTGDGDDKTYNLYRVNCDNKQSVVNGFRWAYSKLIDNGSLMAKACLNSMSKYYNLPDQVSDNRQVIYGQLSPCNIGLKELNGPSLSDTKGIRK